MRRTLAAVMAADIEGYSRLMGENAEATLAALRRMRAEVFGPAIATNRGRVVKSMGDGWIVLFPAIADAAIAAAHIQDRLSKWDAEPALRLRIGLHIGDVVEEEEDVFGDGVNVAARLEGFAKPGAVAISDAVHGGLDGVLRPGFDPAGEHTLKNIDRPVRIWVRDPAAGGARYAAVSRPEGRPLIVIQPLEAGGDDEVGDLAAALTGDLAEYLGAIHWLDAVTARDAGDGYALKLSLRVSGQRVRLEARLQGPDGQRLWSDKYDSTRDDLFAFQDEAARAIAQGALARLTDAERLALAGRDRKDLSADECGLSAIVSGSLFDKEGLRTALSFCREGFARDPASENICALGLLHGLGGRSIGYEDVFAEYRDDFHQWLAAGRTIASPAPLLDLVLAIAAYIQDHDAARFRNALSRVLRRASHDYIVLAFSGFGNLWLGDPQTAHDCFSRARRLGVDSPWEVAIFGGDSTALVMLGRYDSALEATLDGLALSQEFATLYRAAAAARAQLGRIDEARADVEHILRLLPNETVSGLRDRNGYATNELSGRFFDGLRLAGLPD